MDDVSRQNLRIFLKTLLEPSRIFLSFGLSLLVFFFPLFDPGFGFAKMVVIGAIFAIALGSAYSQSRKRLFLDRRFAAHWASCKDRLTRFQEVMRKMRKEQVADLREVPKTIERTAESIYLALRRADMIAHEVTASERGLHSMPPVAVQPTNDPQSNELYRLADKNIAEYRQQFAGVMAGVQRTEAQAAVFMTTVDTLRMKMLGYRLVGRRPELSSHDFLEALAEAKLQLQSIDQALDELDLSHYPKTIAVVQREENEEFRA